MHRGKEGGERIIKNPKVTFLKCTHLQSAAAYLPKIPLLMNFILHCLLKVRSQAMCIHRILTSSKQSAVLKSCLRNAGPPIHHFKLYGSGKWLMPKSKNHYSILATCCFWKRFYVQITESFQRAGTFSWQVPSYSFNFIASAKRSACLQLKSSIYFSNKQKASRATTYLELFLRHILAGSYNRAVKNYGIQNAEIP